MATDTAKVLETLGKMTVLELVELKNAIEEEWGVTAAAPVAVADPEQLLAHGVPAARPPPAASLPPSPSSACRTARGRRAARTRLPAAGPR